MIMYNAKDTVGVRLTLMAEYREQLVGNNCKSEEEERGFIFVH